MGRRVTYVLFAAGLLLGPPLGLWLWLLLSSTPLSGIQVAGSPLGSDPGGSLERELEDRATSWASAEITIHVGEATVRRSRAALGASLPVESLATELRSLGRSGNPVRDLHQWWDARNGRVDLHWAPEIDQALLLGFIEREQERVERLPIAGITDGRDTTLPGQDGLALDVASAQLAVRRALASQASEVALPLERVPAPPPLPIGAPDGALFGQSEEGAPRTSSASAPQMPPTRALAAAARIEWKPERSDDCYEGSSPRSFCDGPRKVPLPHGPAARLAEDLGLGTLATVGHLIGHPPKRAWIEAAAVARPQPGLLWPVPDGKLVRGFGYVRREPLRHRIHKGVDIAAPRGSPIRAASAGIVAYSDNRVRGYGNLLVIVQADGTVTFSAHCERILVFPGERIRRGQIVAEVGATGLALGPHLHFEYHRAGKATDPQPRFAR